jgi:hypothetical protein
MGFGGVGTIYTYIYSWCGVTNRLNSGLVLLHTDKIVQIEL